MLQGILTVKKSHISGVERQLRLDAIDTANSFSARIYADNSDDVDFISGRKDSEDLTSRRFDVGISRVTVECRDMSIAHQNAVLGTLTDSEIKELRKIKNYNIMFFSMLSALIRYVKTNCITLYSDTYSVLQSSTTEFIANPVQSFTIPSTDGTQLAKVTLSYGDITEIHIDSPFFMLDMVTVKELEKIFYAPKFKDVKGFVRSRESLGFEPRTEILMGTHGTGTFTDLSPLYETIEQIIESHRDKEFRWLLDKNYKIVTDETLDEVIDYIYNFDGDVYYDTETTGLRINFLSRIGQADQCVGIIFSVIDGESFYFPMQMKYIKNLCGGDHFYFMEHYARKILEEKNIVVHNLSFDWKVGYIYEINTNITDDTYLLFKCTVGHENTLMPLKLKYLARVILHRDSLELSDLVRDNSWGESNVKFWDLPPELVKLYACADTDNTRGIKCYAYDADLLGKYGAQRLYRIELDFAYAVAYQEFYGHHINIDEVDTLTTEVHAIIAEEKEAMVEIVGHDFNPNSPKQLLKIMYEELGIQKYLNQKGKLSTDKDTLGFLSELTDFEGNVKYPFVTHLKKFRDAEGIRKIIEQFPTLMTPDGFLFQEVRQFGAVTGRLSTSEPNLQSYNDPVKKRVTPRNGYYMTDSDYSSVEYRITGSLSEDEAIIEKFEDPDFDYHTYQASRLFDVVYELVSKSIRKAAKAVNFGLIFGMGDPKLGLSIYGEKNSVNTRRAAGLRKKYFTGQEKILKMFVGAQQEGVTKGYSTTYFGRRRWYDRAVIDKNSIERYSGNHRIQGTAADIYKMAVGRLFKEICRHNWLGKVLLTGFIHDELLSEVSLDIDGAEWLKVLKSCFEIKVDGWCPLYMGFGYGRSWYEAKTVEIPVQLQNEFIETYGDTGFPDWDGDMDKFCDNIPRLIEDWTFRHVLSYIQKEDTWGDLMKSSISSNLSDLLLKDIVRVLNRLLGTSSPFKPCEDNPKVCIPESFKSMTLDELKSKYSKMIEKGDKKGQFEPVIPKLINNRLKLFAELRGIDLGDASYKDISESEGTSKSQISKQDMMEDDFLESEEYKNNAKDLRVDNFGMYVNTETKEVTILLVPYPTLMTNISKICNREGNGYKVEIKDTVKKVIQKTPAYLPYDKIKAVQDIYLEYFRLVSKTASN